MDEFIRFGPGGKLIGILSGTPSPEGETLLLLNAGTFPRSGPFRLHVELAARLSAMGGSVLRVDLPGVGESPRSSTGTELEAIRSAMDNLHDRFGCRRFALGGICSAADQAWRVSEVDDRVTGLLMLDGMSFPGRWFWFGRVARLLRRPSSEWLRRLLRFLRPSPGGAQAPVAADFRDWPTRGEARTHMSRLLARGSRMLFVYTGGASERFVHPRQFAAAFPPAARNGDVELHFWPGCDHLFYLRAYRVRLIDAIVRWMASR